VSTRSVPRIRSHALSRHTYQIFVPALSHYSTALETIAPSLPPAILDLGPRACHRLIPGPRACCRLDPGLGARRRHPLPQVIRVLLLVIITPPPSTLTPPPSEHAIAVDLDPTSLEVRRRRPLPQALDTASDEADTPPLPHYHCCVNVCRNVNVI
jgi:hypothetical protein